MRRLVILALGSLSSCSRDEQPLRPSAAELQGKAIANAAPSGARALEPSKDVSALVLQLQSEAKNRPSGSVTAERVFTALDGAGVSLTGRRQYLGATMKASYCAGGVTPDGIALSVCEYPSAEAAELGKRYMDKRFGAITPYARREVHGSTVLTIAHAAGGNRSDAISRVVTMFKGL